MNYITYYEYLSKYNLISPIWKEVIKLISDNYQIDNSDEILEIFLIYFSLIDEGNLYISLEKDPLKNKWIKRLESTKIELEEELSFDENEFDNLINYSVLLIDNYLNLINEQNLNNLIGEGKLFKISDNRLFTNGFFNSKKSIDWSIKRLFVKCNNLTNEDIDISKYTFLNLSSGQIDILKEGINKNLIITGGPGTGKTTSVLFLLLVLLEQNINYSVKLIAPSGKASSRMKESIIRDINQINESFRNTHQEIIQKIESLESSTIHRLLGINYKNGGYNYNINNQFSKDTIFIVDEASMIDVNLFSALLEAVDTDSRIFIMGDKDQLPSVGAGAVLSDLLRRIDLKNNIIHITKSQRFGEDTYIYKLASAINNGISLPVTKDDFKNVSDFVIEDNNKSNTLIKPIFYYDILSLENDSKKAIEYISNIWSKNYYKDLAKISKDINNLESDTFENILSLSENSRILTAENNGARGCNYINQYISKLISGSSIGYYPGKLLMINKNNIRLDLYNGDTGVVVSFSGDNTLYFMIKKSSSLVSTDGKRTDKIFKIKDFMFYPLRLINSVEIDSAYAITIHKSQGSDYKNILIILPIKKGHPLLNRQIIYTAVTRTKGNTYILSTLDILNESKDRLLTRDTFLN